jgi:sulfoxide reductase heme-binding subunit YedZ
VTRPAQRIRRIQTAAVALACLPVAGLAWGAFADALGANPIETITHETGDWALRFLILALAVTPLRRLLRWTWLAPLRRTCGLTAFGYACLHFTTWLWLEHFFDWDAIVEDVLDRRYVTAGFAALLCMTPLAATSTRAMVRRLGRRWKALHRLAYAAGVLAVVHFIWLVKADLLEPLVYAAVLGALLGIRVWLHLRPRRAAIARPAPTA